jgi:hypothetical protein
MPNLYSSYVFIAHFLSICIYSNPLPGTASSEPIKQGCRVGVAFLAFFGDFAQKLHTALSIFYPNMKDYEGFLTFFGKISPKKNISPSIFSLSSYEAHHIGYVALSSKTGLFSKNLPKTHIQLSIS